MEKWSKQVEEEITLLIKDWLKNKNMTQADLREKLNANSSRMPVLIEVLKKEFSKGGISKISERLCRIENDWSNAEKGLKKNEVQSDPFNQLDLLLEKLREDINN